MSLSHTQVALNADRDCLTTPSPDLLACWAQIHPCLAQAACLADLVLAVQAGTPEVLWSLLDLATHDTEAARVVLHAFRPLIEATARRCANRYPGDEVMSVAVTAMWETIRSFPLHRTHACAAGNLRGDFLKRMCGRQADDSAYKDEALLLSSDVLDTAPHLQTDDHLQADDQRSLALDLVARAYDAGAISHQEARLLVDFFFEDVDDAELSRSLGVSPPTVRQRRSRALRRLTRWATLEDRRAQAPPPTIA